jgi:hypothetical protein
VQLLTGLGTVALLVLVFVVALILLVLLFIIFVVVAHSGCRLLLACTKDEEAACCAGKDVADVVPVLPAFVLERLETRLALVYER